MHRLTRLIRPDSSFGRLAVVWMLFGFLGIMPLVFAGAPGVTVISTPGEVTIGDSTFTLTAGDSLLVIQDPSTGAVSVTVISGTVEIKSGDSTITAPAGTALRVDTNPVTGASTLQVDTVGATPVTVKVGDATATITSGGTVIRTDLVGVTAQIDVITAPVPVTITSPGGTTSVSPGSGTTVTGTGAPVGGPLLVVAAPPPPSIPPLPPTAGIPTGLPTTAAVTKIEIPVSPAK